jgi:hypothetical protein
MSKSQHIYIERPLTNSLAFIKLPGSAAKVLLWFLARRQFQQSRKFRRKEWVNKNNGEIVFSYAEAENKFKLTRPRYSRALDDLIKFGFIDINHHGGGLFKDMTTYYISERWKNYGTPAFKEKSRRKDTRGLGLTSENWEKRTGKKRKGSIKISNENVTTTSNKNVTAYRGITHAPSNKNVTEEIDPNFFIYKGEEVFRHFQLRSNKNVTIL